MVKLFMDQTGKLRRGEKALSKMKFYPQARNNHLFYTFPAIIEQELVCLLCAYCVHILCSGIK